MDLIHVNGDEDFIDFLSTDPDATIEPGFPMTIEKAAAKILNINGPVKLFKRYNGGSTTVNFDGHTIQTRNAYAGLEMCLKQSQNNKKIKLQSYSDGRTEIYILNSKNGKE